MDWAISHSHAVLLRVFTGVRVDERPTSCTRNTRTRLDVALKTLRGNVIMQGLFPAQETVYFW